MNIIPKHGRAWMGLALLLLLAACSTPTPLAPTASPSAALPPGTPTPSTTPLPTLTLTPTPTLTLTPTPTLTPSFTPTRYALPTMQPGKLYTGVQPVSNIQDTCGYLNLRWDPANSTPGTIVVPVMFHSIAKDSRPAGEDTTISELYFHNFMQYAHQLGFETISTTQLIGFLEKNAPIPPRSMLLIIDDRKRFDFFDTLFVPYLKKYNWTVTNAWISHPDTPAYLYKENEQLVPTGLVDFQAHGVIHNTPIEEGVTEAYIRGEIYGSISAIQQHFGKAPNTFVWPRGRFTLQAVQIARQAGYRLGFTASARGPLLFNWIPLGAEERAVNDPLMVLPRYWSTTAAANLDTALQFSQAARDFASKNRENELNWYKTYCGAYPPLNTTLNYGK